MSARSPIRARSCRRRCGSTRPRPVIRARRFQTSRSANTPVKKGDTVYVPLYALHPASALPVVRAGPLRPGPVAPDAVKARHRFAYMPFGAGPRVCIGMGFALTEAVAVLAALIKVPPLHVAGSRAGGAADGDAQAGRRDADAAGAALSRAGDCAALPEKLSSDKNLTRCRSRYMLGLRGSAVVGREGLVRRGKRMSAAISDRSPEFRVRHAHAGRLPAEFCRSASAAFKARGLRRGRPLLFLLRRALRAACPTHIDIPLFIRQISRRYAGGRRRDHPRFQHHGRHLRRVAAPSRRSARRPAS